MLKLRFTGKMKGKKKSRKLKSHWKHVWLGMQAARVTPPACWANLRRWLPQTHISAHIT